MNTEIDKFNTKQVFIHVKINKIENLNDTILGVYENKNKIPLTLDTKIIGPIPFYQDIFKTFEKDLNPIPNLDIKKVDNKPNFNNNIDDIPDLFFF